jgi:hypothetical protein
MKDLGPNGRPLPDGRQLVYVSELRLLIELQSSSDPYARSVHEIRWYDASFMPEIPFGEFYVVVTNGRVEL